MSVASAVSFAGSFAAVDPNGVGPGVGAFLVTAAIALATYFLIRSMNKQLKKINFDEKDTERPRKNAGNGSGPEQRPGR